MYQALPDEWPAMVRKLLSLISAHERGLPPGALIKACLAPSFVKIYWQGVIVLNTLSDPDTGVFKGELELLKPFRRAVKRLVAACHFNGDNPGEPEPMPVVIALCKVLAHGWLAETKLTEENGLTCWDFVRLYPPRADDKEEKHD